jgi:hypothetical protein
MTYFKLTVAIFYVIFGMAILSMCYGLMQREIVEQFNSLILQFSIYDYNMAHDLDDDFNAKRQKLNELIYKNKNKKMLKKNNRAEFI